MESHFSTIAPANISDKAFDETGIGERIDIMMRATHDMIWEWDIEKDYIYRNKDGLKKVYDLDDDSAIQNLDDWLLRVHPDDHQTVRTIVGTLLKAKNEETFELEYRFRKDDGCYIYIYDRGILLKDECDRPVRMIGAAQNISERKRLEQELLKNELAYQKLIHQAAIDSQEQVRSEIGKELHDNVNQVLTTTKLILDLALTTAERREELISKALHNVNTIINEIRQLSRSLMNPTIGDLGIVDSVTDLVESMNMARQTKINLQVDHSLEDELGPREKLAVFRIIQESLNNVLRHANAEKAVVRLKLEDKTAIVEIADNGAGFSPNQIKKGAGLKNIQNRVYLVSGCLSIDSKPGNGCTIKIKFPVAQS